MKKFQQVFLFIFCIVLFPISGECLDYTATLFNRLDSKNAKELHISPGGESFVYKNNNNELVVANYSRIDTAFTNYSQLFPNTIGSDKSFSVLGVGDNGKVLALFKDDTNQTCTVRTFTPSSMSTIHSFPTIFFGGAFRCAFNQDSILQDWAVGVGLSGELYVAGTDNGSQGDVNLRLTKYTEEGSSVVMQQEELPSGFFDPSNIFINKAGSIAIPSDSSGDVFIVNKNARVTQIRSRLRGGLLNGFSNNGKLLFDGEELKNYSIFDIKTKISIKKKKHSSSLSFIDFSDIELPLSLNGLVSLGKERTFECYFRGNASGMKASSVGFLSKNKILAKLYSESGEDLGLGVITAHLNHSIKSRC